MSLLLYPLLVGLWSMQLRRERRRTELARLHKLIDALPDISASIVDSMRTMFDATGKAMAAFAVALPGMMSTAIAAMEREATWQRGVLELHTAVGTGCYCGHVPSDGGTHDHVARMAAGAVPDLVLIAGETFSPHFGLGVVPLIRETIDVHTVVVWDINALVMRWSGARDVLGMQLDRSRPPVCGIPWATTDSAPTLDDYAVVVGVDPAGPADVGEFPTMSIARGGINYDGRTAADAAERRQQTFATDVPTTAIDFRSRTRPPEESRVDAAPGMTLDELLGDMDDLIGDDR